MIGNVRNLHQHKKAGRHTAADITTGKADVAFVGTKTRRVKRNDRNLKSVDTGCTPARKIKRPEAKKPRNI